MLKKTYDVVYWTSEGEKELVNSFSTKTEAEETYQDNVRIQPGDYIIITSKLYQIQLVLSGVPIGKVGEQDKFSHIQLYFGVIKERNDSGESNNAG